MRTSIKIIGICALIGLSFSCTDRDLSTIEAPAEGQPARVAVTFQNGDLLPIESRAASNVDNDVNYVHVLIFDAGNGQPLKTLYKTAYSSGALSIATRSGSSIIYAVTNIGQNPLVSGGESFFDDVASISDFQKKMTKIGQIHANAGQVLPMFGKTTVPVMITAGSNSSIVNIDVHRLTSKITLQVIKSIPATDKVDLISWEVINVPAYSYIEQKSNADAVTDRVELVNDSNYFRSPAQLFSLVTIPGGSGTIIVPQAEFYQFENRKGKVNSVTTQLQRAAKAPVRATYVNIKARYQNYSEVKDVTYRVHLGTDNLTDYNVDRNTHHVYTLTIKGLNNYSTNVVVTKQDSRVVLGDTIFAVDLFEPILDAHYDWRPIRLRAIPGYSRIEIIDNAGNPMNIANSWLKLSLNKTWPTVAELNANATLTPTTNLNPLHHVAGMGNMTVYLYADEMFVNDVPITTERALNLRFTYTNSTNPANLNVPDSCYTILRAITQRPPLTMGNMGIRAIDELGGIIPGNGSVFVIERRDEFAMKLAATGLAATPLDGMRWGFTGIVKQPLTIIPFEFYRTNGLKNTIAMVYHPGNVLLDQTSVADLGTPAYTGAFDPIYNTYAARYAFEKNRDLDGNGKIEGNEIKWFFPSRAELMLIWVGKQASNAAANEKMVDSYWGSSESGSLRAINMNFYDGGTGGDFSKNTINHVRAVRKIVDPTPAQLKSPYIEAGTRLIKGLPAGVSVGHPVHVKGQPYPKHGSEQALNTVAPAFEVARQDAAANGSATPIPGMAFMEWYVAAGWTSNWQNSSAVASPATGCNAYWEVSATDATRGSGMWRMPTQRELLTIWMLRKELIYDGFVPIAALRYWSAPNYYSESWFTDFSSGYTGVPYRNAGDPPYQYSVRCVRDVTP